ncbi:MAG: response regulator [Elusimicrobiota bacterium]
MATATKTTILVVDDDAHFRETLSDAMSLKDVEVSGAPNGAEAARLLGRHKPSLILLDVQLPDVHGFNFCRKLKKDQRYRNVPVVLLSAKYTEPADRAEGLLAGADAYLSKPINLEALWEEVRYLLDKSE